MTNPAVTIAIVSYKSAILTIRCLESISRERQSTPYPVQVVVVDNASGDYLPLLSAAKENGWNNWITLIQAPRNGGFGYGNNIAIFNATKTTAPKYVYLLNPDTELRPNAITTLVDFLESHQDVGIAGSSFENQDGSDWPIAFRFPNLLGEVCQCLGVGIISRIFQDSQIARIMPKSAQPTDWVSGASMMVRSDVFSAIGGFDENYFLYFEETDFSCRAKRLGFLTWYVPASRVMHVSGYSTHVTSASEKKQRLPAYWFESRRRYYALNVGLSKAKIIDVIAVIAATIGLLKKVIAGQKHQVVPYFVRDLWRHSIVRRRNQSLPAATTQLHS